MYEIGLRLELENLIKIKKIKKNIISSPSFTYTHIYKCIAELFSGCLHVKLYMFITQIS